MMYDGMYDIGYKMYDVMFCFILYIIHPISYITLASRVPDAP